MDKILVWRRRCGEDGRIEASRQSKGYIGGKEPRKLACCCYTVDLEDDESNDDNDIHLEGGVDAAVHGFNFDGQVALQNNLPVGESLAMMII